MQTYIVSDPDIVNQLYSEKSVELSYFEEALGTYEEALSIHSNLYATVQVGGTKQSAIVTFKHDRVCIVESVPIGNLTPRNAEQTALVDALLDDSIKMLTLTGPAGTGKTILTLAAAVKKIQDKTGPYKYLILSKPRAQVTDGFEEMGEVPGDMLEKMSPQLLSYEAAMRKVWGDKSAQYWDMLIEKGIIKVIPLEHMRGIDFDKSIVVVDEAQNMGPNQYKTLTTRVNESSRLICLGDTQQTDRNILNSKRETPMESVAYNRFYKDSPLTAHIELIRVERSPLTSLMVKIFNDFSQGDQIHP